MGDDATAYLGAFVPGDAKFEEPNVVELPPINSDLPAEFDSMTKWPQCSVIGNVRDQSSCGSCWAFGSVSSFESRRCIATGEDTKFSPEDTAFCQGLFGAGNGCNGGNSAWSWFKSHGVVTGGDNTDVGSGDTCLPYSFAACAHHVPATASYPACPSGEYPSPKCAKACSEDGYSASYDSDKHMASSAYSVRKVAQIQQDLVTNGPMLPSPSTAISQLTNLECTLTSQDPVWEVTPSLWLDTALLTALITGRSRTAGMRSGAMVATF